MDRKNRKELLQSYRERSVIGGVFSIVNTANGKKMTGYTTDMQGSRNRFEFSQNMNSCVHPRLKDDWKEFGGKAFRFEVLDTLEKGEEQNDSDFQNDVKSLFELTTNGAQPDRYE